MKRFLLISALIVLPATAGYAQQPPAGELTLEADLTDKKLHALLDGERVRTWTVAVGTSKHPTPVGQFSVKKMIWNPGWVPPPTEWAKKATPKKPGDPDNPMRVVKVFFKQPDYYIHGTNRPESLGTAASHGCIRMSEEDVLELGKMLMEHSGEWRSPSWFRRLFTRDTSSTVYLGSPIEFRIAKDLPDAEPDVETDAGEETDLPPVVSEPAA